MLVLGCSCCEGRDGQNASRNDCCGNERLKTNESCCEMLSFTALPPSLALQQQQEEKRKESASKDLQIPTSSLLAVLTIDVRVKKISDLEIELLVV